MYRFAIMEAFILPCNHNFDAHIDEAYLADIMQMMIIRTVMSAPKKVLRKWGILNISHLHPKVYGPDDSSPP